jgi:RNA polymerase sigma factor (sigma-70 family)
MASSDDSQAWVLEAVDLYELPLLRYARRLLGDVDLAADAVQHAFVKLCGETRQRLAGREAAWLFRVCRNRALDQLRQAGRERAAADPAGPADATAAVADRGPDPAVSVERRELAARLRRLLAELPPPQREAIDLWCEGFTHREIAEITGRQEGHVRVLTHRGLTALRRHPAIRDLLAAEPSADSPVIAAARRTASPA